MTTISFVCLAILIAADPITTNDVNDVVPEEQPSFGDQEYESARQADAAIQREENEWSALYSRSTAQQLPLEELPQWGFFSRRRRTPKSRRRQQPKSIKLAPLFTAAVQAEVKQYADLYLKYVNPKAKVQGFGHEWDVSRLMTDKPIIIPASIGMAFDQDGIQGGVFKVDALGSKDRGITTAKYGDRMVLFRHMEASIKDLSINLGGLGGEILPFSDASNVCTGCKIHRGYFRAMTKLLADHKFQAALSGSHSITLSGYSQGAGLALVLGALLHKQGRRLKKVVGFDGCKVGNQAFQRWAITSGLYDKIWRITYQKDIVARLPPQSMGYYPVGWEIHYVCPSHGHVENWFNGGPPKYKAVFCKAEDSAKCGVQQYTSGSALDHIVCPLNLGTDLDFLNRCTLCKGFQYQSPKR